MKGRKVKPIEGYFISFTPEEKNDIDSFLESEGYPADDTGVKQFILDTVYEKEESGPDAGERLAELIKCNPELVMRTVAGARGVFKYIKSLHK